MIEILTGDALELLPALPGEPPNLIPVDPPYNVGKDYGAGIDDRRPLDEFTAWLLALASACYEVAAEDATCYWFCPAFQLLDRPYLPGILRAAGWNVRVKELPIWYRPNGPGPRMRARGQAWARMSEHIVMATKGAGIPPKPSGLPRGEQAPWYHNVITVNTPQTNHPRGRWHVCEKPVRLYRYLIQAHQGVTRVLDPTVGSGSSMVACAELGIDGIGIELNPESAQLARDRVAAALAGIPYREARRGTQPLFRGADG